MKEAEDARKNRAEIVKARSQGRVTRRELFKWGIFTSGGLLVAKNGLSPFARSAFAAVPTGTPPSPVPAPGDTPFTTDLLRLHNLTPQKLTPVAGANGETDLAWPSAAWTGEDGTVHPAETIPAMRRSNHPDSRGINQNITHTVNVRPDPRGPSPSSTGPVGPREGRAPGEAFAHQRWDQLLHNTTGSNPFTPVGFVVSHGQIVTPGSVPGPFSNVGFNFSISNNWPTQLANSIWTFGEGRFVAGGNSISTALRFPVLLQARYGESVILRDYNNLPFEIENNGGFGRQEPTTHNHNAHNGAESDGAANAHFFPGEYYDYLWSTILARSDAGLKDSKGRDLDKLIGVKRGDPRASTPTNDGGIIKVPGDFREIQGTMWFHDHRIFFTSENVYKGYAALLEYFSGPDRGYERPGLSAAADAVNLRLPSGFRNKKTWGNRDFDVYLLIQDIAFTPDGQLFFDIFDTDGFLGDVMHVNFQWKPTFKVLPRKYRFRNLSAGMSRWIQLAVADSLDPNTAKAVPITMIANDGNIFPRFVRNLPQLDQQGTAERYDFVIDFSQGQNPASQVGKKFYLVNLLQFSNGRKPDGTLTLAQALSGQSSDPAVGALMEFEVVSEVESIDEPGTMNTIANACGANDMSRVVDPDDLGSSWQIPTVEPTRTRVLEFVRQNVGDTTGMPFDHPLGAEPWGIKVNGGPAHGEDMRRVSNLPRPGDIEHWTLKSGGGWGHPVHLHFEEAITLNRDGKTDRRSIHPGEFRKRKDVWHIGGVAGGQGGNPTFQPIFGEFGGAYVNHCHNTVHEDNAMLLRYDLIRGNSNATGIDQTHITVLPQPDPRAEGVRYADSCNLAEGNPQGFDTGVDVCPEPALGPVAGPQGDAPGGLVDLPPSGDPRTL